MTITEIERLPKTPLDLYVSCKTPRNGFDISRQFRARRCYRKLLLGMDVAHLRGYTVRTFALTESDYAIGMNINFGKALNKFNNKMRRDYGSNGEPMGFSWVEHFVKDSPRLNRHYTQWGKLKLDLDD